MLHTSDQLLGARLTRRAPENPNEHPETSRWPKIQQMYKRLDNGVTSETDQQQITNQDAAGATGVPVKMCPLKKPSAETQ